MQKLVRNGSKPVLNEGLFNLCQGLSNFSFGDVQIRVSYFLLNIFEINEDSPDIECSAEMELPHDTDKCRFVGFFESWVVAESDCWHRVRFDLAALDSAVDSDVNRILEFDYQ